MFDPFGVNDRIGLVTQRRCRRLLECNAYGVVNGALSIATLTRDIAGTDTG
jgi:hypothetical protein